MFSSVLCLSVTTLITLHKQKYTLLFCNVIYFVVLLFTVLFLPMQTDKFLRSYVCKGFCDMVCCIVLSFDVLFCTLIAFTDISMHEVCRYYTYKLTKTSMLSCDIFFYDIVYCAFVYCLFSQAYRCSNGFTIQLINFQISSYSWTF